MDISDDKTTAVDDARKGWSPMSTAPRNAKWITLLTEDRGTQRIVSAHYAEDLSGEEQPPFKGWFEETDAHGFSEVHGKLIGWKEDRVRIADLEDQLRRKQEEIDLRVEQGHALNKDKEIFKDQLRREREASEEFAGYHNELVADLVEKMEKYSAQVADLEAQLRQEREARERLPADWWTDSSLETWFPITAEIVQRQQAAIGAYEKQIAQLQATVGQLREFLEAIVIAFKEPDGGPCFKLRAFAEKHGIYADDLGRDRVMLRIAQAALDLCPGCGGDK